MVKVLVSQGWSKNEIIYEMQRVFGNDVLILPKNLDDERGLIERLLPVALTGVMVGFFFIHLKTRQSLAMT